MRLLQFQQSSESPRAVARNVLDCVQQATEARRDRELSQTMVCLQNTVQMTQKSFHPWLKQTMPCASSLHKLKACNVKR